VAQSPPGCIVAAPGQAQSKPPLLDFGVLQEYIIPRKAFFNRYMTVADPDGRFAVLGFPVSIPNSKYQRNEFIFNFGLVVEADVDQIPYERVVRRLAVTFAEMEKQNDYLSQEDRSNSTATGGSGGSGGGSSSGHRVSDSGLNLHHRRPIESLLEIIKEDLNNYGECMIPVDEANTINMKLFPHYAAPPLVKGWHVPVARMRFADVVDATWDLTLQKVIAQIDGVSDVRRIAWAADVELDLAQLALRHLLYYDAIILLDIFFFGACYAPRPGIHEFVANVGGVVDECANYVCIHGASVLAAPLASDVQQQQQQDEPLARNRSQSQLHSTAATSRRSDHHSAHPDGATSRRPVSNYQLIKLMTTFCTGKSVMEWLRGHLDSGFDVLRYIDVRRFVQFGILKGYLYRVHKYVVSKQYLAALATGQSRPFANAEAANTAKGGEGGKGDPLQRYTDGRCCFDQIITEQNLTDGEIMDRLKQLPVAHGDLTVFYK
jgi:nitrogen permease regulator 2-like protein